MMGEVIDIDREVAEREKDAAPGFDLTPPTFDQALTLLRLWNAAFARLLEARAQVRIFEIVGDQNALKQHSDNAAREVKQLKAIELMVAESDELLAEFRMLREKHRRELEQVRESTRKAVAGA